jgi:hypothetical protein
MMNRVIGPVVLAEKMVNKIVCFNMESDAPQVEDL